MGTMGRDDFNDIKRRFGIIGKSKALCDAIHMAVQVAKTDLGVLITGENGSGKESFAQLIHHRSIRKHNKLMVVNCASIPDGTIESELFGHEKGAFTSASEKRKGYFEEADGGTIFLDEIGDMPIARQPSLLRVLENKEYMRVGSSEKRTTDVRVIAATNIDLHNHIAEGKFRQDLYYRIAQVHIHIPPLRERREDVPPLLDKFIFDFSDTHDTEPIQLTPEAIELLQAYPFPGNVRELKNLVLRLSALEKDNHRITPEILNRYLPKRKVSTPSLVQGPNLSIGGSSFSEQEWFYKSIATLQEEMEKVKKVLFTLLQRGHQGEGRGGLLTESRDLFGLPAVDDKATSNPSVEDLPPTHSEGDREEDPMGSLSIKDNVKRLIVKALVESKNHEEAAEKLEISVRTLYRKLHDYELKSLLDEAKEGGDRDPKRSEL